MGQGLGRRASTLFVKKNKKKEKPSIKDAPPVETKPDVVIMVDAAATTRSKDEDVALDLDKGTRDEFPLCGIDLEYIRSLVKDDSDNNNNRPIKREWTIDEMCNNYVKPQSKDQSFASFLAGNKDTTNHVKRKADFFVSYAWKYTIGDVLDALSARNGFIWMDVFVVNQHTSSEVGLEKWLDTFGGAIQEIGLVVPILIPWEKPIPIQRSWCTFELYTATKFKVRTEVELTPSDKLRFQEAMASCEIDGSNLQNLFSDLNVETASAFKETDRLAILNKIKKDGSENVNDIVINPLKNWLIVSGQEAERKYTDIVTNTQDPDSFEELGNVKAAMGAIIAFATGDLNAAITYKRQALDCWKLAGQHDLVIAVAMNNLAVFLKQNGIYDEALTLYEGALELRRKHLDENCFDIQQNLNNIAALYFAQDKFAEALEIEIGVVSKYRALGLEDAICAGLSTVGLCSLYLNKLEEAEAALTESLEIKKRIFGDENIATAISKINYARMLQKKGTQEDLRKAVQHLEEAQTTARRILGPAHCIVGTSIQFKALCLYLIDGEDKEKVKALGEEGISIISAHLGAEHPETLKAIQEWKSIVS